MPTPRPILTWLKQAQATRATFIKSIKWYENHGFAGAAVQDRKVVKALDKMIKGVKKIQCLTIARSYPAFVVAGNGFLASASLKQ